MKKLISLLLLLSCLLTVAACGDAAVPPADTKTEGTEGTDMTTAASDTTVSTPADDTTADEEGTQTEQRQWNIRVTFVTPDKEVTPYTEPVYAREVMDFGYGKAQTVILDGMLMFVSVTKHLPTFADKVPTAPWSEAFTLRYEMSEGVTYRGGSTFSVYGEDFSSLASKITREELILKGNSEWKGKTVYLEFGGVFYRPYDEEITEDISNAYFVKITF